MIEILITKTYKGYSPKDHWTRMHDIERNHFANLAQMRTWLKEKYGNRKRVPMYIDDKDGKAKRIGWVISGKGSEWNNDGSKYNFITQDWIEVRETHTIDPNRKDL